MIQIRRVYDPPLPTDGVRVLCTTRWPRGVSRQAVDTWKRELGTPPDLLDPWLAGRLGPDEFQAGVRAALLAPAASAALDELAALARQGTALTLLTSIKDMTRTHLGLVQAAIEQRL